MIKPYKSLLNPINTGQKTNEYVLENPRKMASIRLQLDFNFFLHMLKHLLYSKINIYLYFNFFLLNTISVDVKEF